MAKKRTRKKAAPPVDPPEGGASTSTKDLEAAGAIIRELEPTGEDLRAQLDACPESLERDLGHRYLTRLEKGELDPAHAEHQVRCLIRAANKRS